MLVWAALANACGGLEVCEEMWFGFLGVFVGGRFLTHQAVTGEFSFTEVTTEAEQSQELWQDLRNIITMHCLLPSCLLHMCDV